MFALFGPHPRLRLYTRANQYARLATRIATGRLNRGDEVRQLEERMSQILGRRFLAAPMARTAIFLAVKALIQPGQKVIMSPYTIADVVNMVVAAGGEPLFAELDGDTCNISASSVERLLGQEENVGAVMVTHFYGLICEVERIGVACRRRGVPLIEDAAQAFGAQLNGRYAGAFGDVGVYSFGLFKNVNAFYGGGLAVADEQLAERLRAELSKLPQATSGRLFKRMINGVVMDAVTFPPFFSTFFFRLFRYGILHDIPAIANRLKIDVNPQLTRTPPQEYFEQMAPAQAALILSQLEDAPRHLQRRIEVAKAYDAGLSGAPGLTTPPLRTDGSHAYWYYPLIAENREELVAEALRRGRDITASYHRNCADLECFAPWAVERPIARETAASVIYLPTYPGYSDSEIQANIQVIRAISEERAAGVQGRLSAA